MRLGDYSQENHNESQKVRKYDILESYHSWLLLLLPTQSLYPLPTHSHSATTSSQSFVYSPTPVCQNRYPLNLSTNGHLTVSEPV